VLNLYIRLRGLLDREEGQGLVEYALILVLVAIVVIAVLSLMGAQIQNAFRDVTNTLAG
jgi:pilus assembly protein Flp/PilA